MFLRFFSRVLIYLLYNGVLRREFSFDYEVLEMILNDEFFDFFLK